MRNFLVLLALLMCSQIGRADEPASNPITTPTPPPAARKGPVPTWGRGVAVVVVVGAEVLAGVDGQSAPANLILRVSDLSHLGSAPAGAVECVFEAHAWATLSSERVTVRPRRLQCFDALSRELPGRAVAGFAVDQDARSGIKGNIVWGSLAKELLLLGVGAKSSGASRFFSSALGRASFGLTDAVTSADDAKGASPEVQRELRAMETLLPTLSLAPGREFDVVLQGATP